VFHFKVFNFSAYILKTSLFKFLTKNKCNVFKCKVFSNVFIIKNELKFVSRKSKKKW